MKNIQSVSGLGLTGWIDVSVINPDGSTAFALPPIRNLWLDQGLDALARLAIPDAFNVCAKGISQVATKEAIHASNTYTLAGNTVTRNASPATPRNFTADDVGKLIRTSGGGEVVITGFTDIRHVDVQPVGQNVMPAFAGVTITMYSVQLTGLASEAFVLLRVETISKTDGSGVLTTSAGVFSAADVGKAIFVRASGADEAVRMKITGYTSATVVATDHLEGALVARNFLIYSHQGDDELTPISRTSVTSSVSGENSTLDTRDGGGLLIGERVMKRTLVFAPEPEVIAYDSTVIAGAYSWTGMAVVKLSGGRAFAADDEGRYIKFTSTGEYAKIVTYTDGTHITVDRAPGATIPTDGIKIYGGTSYDGVAFSDSDEPIENANILVRFEDGSGNVTPVLVSGANPELPGQQLKVSYTCKVTLAPATLSARTAAPISDPSNLLSSNKFGKFVVEGLALASIDSDGSTVGTFDVLEPSEAGYLGISPIAVALVAFGVPDRSAGAVSNQMSPLGYTPGDFTQVYEGQFDINEANASNWRTIGIYDVETDAFAFSFLFESAQTKSGEVILVIRFRKSWNRDLS